MRACTLTFEIAQPGCVLRKSNSAILEKKGIISSNEAASCKRNMNRCGIVEHRRHSSRRMRLCAYSSPTQISSLVVHISFRAPDAFVCPGNGVIVFTRRFGYVGDLEDRPEASCLYHSEEAENQFMSDPRRAALGDGFRLRPGEEGAKSKVSIDNIDVP